MCSMVSTMHQDTNNFRRARSEPDSTAAKKSHSCKEKKRIGMESGREELERAVEHRSCRHQQSDQATMH